MNSRTLSVMLGLAVITVSCGSNSDFDAKTILEASPVNMDGEQASLSPKDIECGVQAELWESPTRISDDRSVARLNSKARALNFSDDVNIEPNNRAYVQVRGAFPLQVDDVTDAGAGGDTKLVAAKVRVKIPHPCFQNSLPVMGVKRGGFQYDTPASFSLRLDKDGWRVEKIVH